MQQGEPFPRKQALLIALVSFSNCITSPIYSAFVPLLLSRRFQSTAVIGAILTGCNLLSILSHPLTGSLSDGTRSPFGRRRPYILIGAFVCGVAFLLIPRIQSMPLLVICLCVYCYAVAMSRAPTSAWMVDTVPAAYVDRCCALISCMIAASGCLAYFLGNVLYSLSDKMDSLFAAAGILSIVIALLSCCLAKEAPLSQSDTAHMLHVFPRRFPKRNRKKLLLLLGMVLFAYVGYTAYDYYFVLFVGNVLRRSAAQATLYLGIGQVSYLFFCVWIALTKRALPALKMVRLGILLLFCAFGAGFLLCLATGRGELLLLRHGWLLYPVCVLCGAAWGCFNVYTLPVLLRLNDTDASGEFVSWYYICTGTAMVFAPLLYGVLRDQTGSYKTLFLFAALMCFLSLICLFLAKRQNTKYDGGAI